MDLPEKGDRIELIRMGLETDGRPDPSPMEPGSRGTVRHVHRTLLGHEQHQISVDWDPEVGRSLSLVVPPDEFRIIERAID